MKNTIKNMIDFELLTRVRNSVNADLFLPEKNNLVSIIPLEFFSHSLKVLIDGKIFIAEIDEKIPLKAELIAFVVEKNPITLSLNLTHLLTKNKNILFEQISEIFKITNTERFKELISKIILEEKPLIKSKYLQLEKITQRIKVKDLELTLLINLVWKYSEKEIPQILDLYENLFAISFSTVCKYLFNSIKNLLLNQEDIYLLNEVNSKLIYDTKRENTSALQNKSEILLNLIKYFNDSNYISTDIDEFIKFSSIYILQKSVFKDYDFYPDFVVIKRGSGLSFIKYNIKKLYLSNGLPSYKLEFEHGEIPAKVKGFLRNNFLVGSIDIEKYDSNILQKEINDLKNGINEKWQIKTELNINEDQIYFAENNFHKNGINKLVS
ncbi:MAG: hypothetical protein IPM32_07150 [Ignavibacteriae bacterium]|nr:hypothetical protein [Ignavibacteriota bacterium]